MLSALGKVCGKTGDTTFISKSESGVGSEFKYGVPHHQEVSIVVGTWTCRVHGVVGLTPRRSSLVVTVALWRWRLSNIENAFEYC